MSKMGFSDHWVDRVMDRVSTSQFSFSINGEPVACVVPSRGLHQGCPLSPYLFLICAEGFTNLLRRMENEGRLMGVVS